MFTRRTALYTVLAVGIAAAAGGIYVRGGASAPPEDASYVGPEKCKLCHKKRYRSWNKSAHGTAFDDLLPEERDMDKCVKCHVTGFGEGGFESASATPELKHVTCGACHGPGSAHVKAAGRHIGEESGWDTKIDATPGARCNKCHNTHIDFSAKAKELRSQRE